jgi:DNA-nicking Smr family endonuclease
MNGDRFTLDLHGVRHKDVSRKIDTFIGDHLLNGTSTIFIMTGRSPDMKKIVDKTLGDYQMTSIEHINNPGIVTVSLS